MSETLRIIDELERDHAGEPWHGSPVTAILRGVTAAQAAARVIPQGHTAWELVLHMTAWKNEVRHRLSGGAPGEPAEGDWPEVGATTEERWAEALARLDAAHAAVIDTVRSLSEGTLFAAPTVQPASPSVTPTSFYVLLHGLAQHDAYHAGQLALVLKAARSL